MELQEMPQMREVEIEVPDGPARCSFAYVFDIFNGLQKTAICTKKCNARNMFCME